MINLTKLLALLIAATCATLAWSVWSMPLSDEFIPNLIVYLTRAGSVAAPLCCLAALVPPTFARRLGSKAKSSVAARRALWQQN